MAAPWEKYASTQTAPSGPWKGYAQPTAPQDVSSAPATPTAHETTLSERLHNIAESGAAGAGIGAAFGAIDPLGGPALGAVAGGITGLVSGAAGEAADMLGANKWVRFATETAAGGLTGAAESIGGDLAKIISRFMLPGHKATAIQQGAEEVQSYFTSDLEKGMTKAERMVKSEKLGEKARTIETPVEHTVTQDAVQSHLKTELGKIGIPVQSGEKASTAVRGMMYKNMDVLADRGQPFIASPQYQALVSDLKTLRARPGRLSPKEMDNLNAVLANQTSKNPEIRKTASEDILNLIQNGGAYIDEGASKQLISPDAQSALRTRFNEYLQSHGGTKLYDFLKSVEANEFRAQSVDSIHTYAREGFTRIGGDKFAQDMLNIKLAGPQAQQALEQAITQHFYDVPVNKFDREFIRIAKAIRDTKTDVIPDAKLDEIRKVLARIPKDIPAAHARLLAIKGLQGIFTGAIAPQYPQQVGARLQ